MYLFPFSLLRYSLLPQVSHGPLPSPTHRKQPSHGGLHATPPVALHNVHYTVHDAQSSAVEFSLQCRLECHCALRNGKVSRGWWSGRKPLINQPNELQQAICAAFASQLGFVFTYPISERHEGAQLKLRSTFEVLGQKLHFEYSRCPPLTI